MTKPLISFEDILYPNDEYSEDDAETKSEYIEKMNPNIINHNNVISISELILTDKATDIISKKLPEDIKMLLDFFKDFPDVSLLFAYETAYDIICTKQIPEEWNFICLNSEFIGNITSIVDALNCLGFKYNNNKPQQDSGKYNINKCYSQIKLLSPSGVSVYITIGDNIDLFTEYKVLCPYIPIDIYKDYDYIHDYLHGDSDIKYTGYYLNALDKNDPYHRAEIYAALVNIVNFVPYQILYDFNAKQVILSHSFYNSYLQSRTGYFNSTPNTFILKIADKSSDDEFNSYDHRFAFLPLFCEYNLVDAAKLMMKNIITVDVNNDDIILLQCNPSNLYNYLYARSDDDGNSTISQMYSEYDGNKIYVKKNQCNLYYLIDDISTQYDNKLKEEFNSLTFKQKYKEFKDLLKYAYKCERLYSNKFSTYTLEYGKNIISSILVSVFPNLLNVYNFILKNIDHNKIYEYVRSMTCTKYVDLFDNLTTMLSNYVFLRGTNFTVQYFTELTDRDIETITLAMVYLAQSFERNYKQYTTFLDTDMAYLCIKYARDMFQSDKYIYDIDDEISENVDLMFDLIEMVFMSKNSWSYQNPINKTYIVDYVQSAYNNLFRDIDNILLNYDIFQKISNIENIETLMSHINILFYFMFNENLVKILTENILLQDECYSLFKKQKTFMQYIDSLNIDDKKLTKYLLSKKNSLKTNYYFTDSNTCTSGDIKKYLAYLISEGIIPNDEDALMEEVYKII